MQGADRTAAIAGMAAECLSRSGALRLRVMGGSMIPSIYPGSRVRIRAASLYEIKRGDIVLVAREGGLRLHRLMDVAGDRLILRGDSHEHDDLPVRVTALLGVLEKVEEKPSVWRRARMRLNVERGR